MINYLLKRIGYSLLIILGVVTLIFMLFNALPGDPARMMMGQRSDEKSLQIIRKDLGLDKPIGVQYLSYINDLSPISLHSSDSTSFFYLDKEKYGNFKSAQLGSKIIAFKAPYLRRSYLTQKPVGEIISETLPNSFILALLSMVLASILGIGIGILVALKKGTWLDKATLALCSTGMAVPSFFAAVIIGWLFAYVLGDFTGLNLTGNLYEVDPYGNGINLMLQNMVLPVITLAVRPLSVVVQLTRNSLLEVFSQDYIRTAKAKGLSTRKVVMRHALKNSLNPVVGAISGWFASMMAGVVFVEYIFGWKGLGFTMVQALSGYDLPIVMGCVVTFSIIFVVVNLLTDITYGLLDPRVRLNG
ncbi:ABC transporter permease [Alistipes sp. ZOR0009]|uniref:ABC transporter permease n=1 Tax=Alistipes sp. ZOR0009 TaxID=1339253 RepID=UPI0006472236|nr:ABC transporter permease [Alistipes sp. ZOR0009]